MKIDKINKLTDEQLQAHKLYYANRQAEFKEYYDEYMIACSVLYDIKEEIQKRANVGKRFKHKYKNIYIYSIGNSSDVNEHRCLFIEEDYSIGVDDTHCTFLTHDSYYAEISKEEFLKQYAIAVNHLLSDIDPNMSMVLNKEDVND